MANEIFNFAAEQIDQLCHQDQALSEEVASKFRQRIANAALEELSIVSGPSIYSDAAPRSGYALEGVFSQRARDVRRLREEAIVRADARPVLVVRNNAFVPEFSGPESNYWKTRLAASATMLNRAIPAVGRIEVHNHPDFEWVGTGWLAAPNIIVTNRHVARHFARRTSDDFRFRVGVDRANLVRVSVDFREEYQSRQSFEVKVNDVLWIAPINGPDIAFLNVEFDSRQPPPQPIPLATKAAETDTAVVTIGYPSKDIEHPDQELVKSTFGDVYDKKRMAPGFITDFGPRDVIHDCSTLAGNSGSVVLDINTGEAVGVHYAGEFKKSNYAVPISYVSERLRQINTPGNNVNNRPSIQHQNRQDEQGQTTSSQEIKATICLPIEITIKLGDLTNPTSIAAIVSNAPEAREVTLDEATNQLSLQLDSNKNVIEVRKGYRFVDNRISDQQVIVVVVENKAPEKLIDVPATFGGHDVVVRYGSVLQQLRHQGFAGIDILERRNESINYKKPENLSLDEVDETMDAIFHASPDAGFPVLRDFLRRTEESLVGTIYEFDAKHVLDELLNAVTPGNRTFKFATQKLPRDRHPDEDECDLSESSCDLDLRRAVVELEELGDKFEHVPVPTTQSDQLFATAYHIKVFVRDEEEFWLSSGNLKNSGQPNIDPVAEGETSFRPFRRANREWHAVVKNEQLAKTFADYIRYDFDESTEILEARRSLESPSFPFPEILIPEVPDLDLESPSAEATFFEPLILENQQIRIQPLLTPDNYLKFIPDLIRNATKRVWIQNQSFNLKGFDNEPEFIDLLKAIVEQQQKPEMDVRIIFRDNREFPRGDNRELLERLKDFGFDTSSIKVQRRCHNKGMIIDSSIAMLGSHNWTNAGVLVNRDASLIVHHAAVAEYYEKIFEFDWNNLATQQVPESVPGVRTISPESDTPRGMRRVDISEIMPS